MNDKDLRQLAKDFFKNRVVSQHNCESVEELFEVFTPLEFMSEEHNKEMYDLVTEGGLIYEYYDSAIKQRISDRMPTFLCFQSLKKEDAEKMFNYVKWFRRVRGDK